jgi:4-hydroxybenzoate polyprenyltransferase
MAGRNALALWRTTRPFSSLAAGVLSAGAIMSAREDFVARGIVAGLAMCSLTMFGFVVNDIFDYRKDRAAGVTRPIATGELSLRKAWLLAGCLLLFAGATSRAAGGGAGILAATSVALLLYSPVAQRIPLIKGMYVGGLCCAPLAYGATAGDAAYSWLSYATLACFVAGREAVMDADELNGDRRAGIETIAAMLGASRSRRMGVALMVMAAGGLLATVNGSAGRIAAATALASLLCVLGWPGLEENRRIRWSRFPMLIGAVAIACGGA